MYLALCVEYGRDDQLIFAQQLGVEHVVMAVECWDAASLAHAKNRVEQATLTLAGLEGLSLAGCRGRTNGFAGDRGEWHWSRSGGAATGWRPRASGTWGALVGMPVRASSDPPGLARILAAADAANVRLALGADVAGVGVDLDLAITREGAYRRSRARALIEECGERLLIARAGNVAAGRQAFLNEGEVDLPQALLALQRVGFAGPLCAGPPPGLVGDTDWGHKGRAYDLGYLRAVLQTIESL